MEGKLLLIPSPSSFHCHNRNVCFLFKHAYCSRILKAPSPSDEAKRILQELKFDCNKGVLARPTASLQKVQHAKRSHLDVNGESYKYQGDNRGIIAEDGVARRAMASESEVDHYAISEEEAIMTGKPTHTRGPSFAYSEGRRQPSDRVLDNAAKRLRDEKTSSTSKSISSSSASSTEN